MQHLLGIQKHDSEIANIHRLQVNDGTAVTKEDEESFILHGDPEPTLEKPLKIFWGRRLSPYNVHLASQFANVLIYNFPEMKDDVHDIENHFLDRIRTLSSYIKLTKGTELRETVEEILTERQVVIDKRSRLNERRTTVCSFFSIRRSCLIYF